jgi:hypothetical protein
MFDLTRRVERAAQLVAAGDLTLEAIAQEVGGTSRTLRNWRGREAFGSRVEEIRAESSRHSRSRGPAERVHRAVAYLVVIGGRGGLGEGDDAAELVPIYAVDAGRLKRLRELEGESPGDFGQRMQKTELTGRDGQPPAAPPEPAIAEVYGEAVLNARVREQGIDDDRG